MVAVRRSQVQSLDLLPDGTLVEVLKSNTGSGRRKVWIYDECMRSPRKPRTLLPPLLEVTDADSMEGISVEDDDNLPLDGYELPALSPMTSIASSEGEPDDFEHAPTSDISVGISIEDEDAATTSSSGKRQSEQAEESKEQRYGEEYSPTNQSLASILSVERLLLPIPTEMTEIDVDIEEECVLPKRPVITCPERWIISRMVKRASTVAPENFGR